MKTSPTKRSFQAALALTLLACSGLTGCSEGQEQNASSSADGKAAVATTHTKAATATPKASSKAKATGTPTATGASSTTSSPTATLSPELEASREQARNKQPPPKPELITVNNDDGAIATAKYWVQLYHYSSGKTNEYKALCPGDNFGCAGIIKGAIENHSEGGWVEPADIKFTEAYRRDDFPDSMVVQINYKQDGFNQYYGDGSAKYYKPESRWALVELSYRNNQWIVIRQKNGSFD